MPKKKPLIQVGMQFLKKYMLTDRVCSELFSVSIYIYKYTIIYLYIV